MTSTFLTLGLLLGVVAFGAGSSLGAAAVAVVVRTADLRRWSSRTLFALRLAPTACGLLLAFGLFLPAWVAFEPRQTTEPARGAVLILAASTVLVAALGLARGAWAFLKTSRALAAWAGRATPMAIPDAPAPVHVIDDPFPLVALSGLFRPRLLVARQVLAACEPAELSSVLAHEAAHLDARDNLRGLLIQSTPDLLTLLPSARRLEAAWREAAELEADTRAGHGESGRVALAAAIVKVARLAASGPPLAMAIPGLHDGGPIERRVRRLLSLETEDGGRGLSPAALVTAGAGVAVALALAPVPWLRLVHGAAEWIVRV
jgi:Zn-dependent protease with chaperone function